MKRAILFILLLIGINGFAKTITVAVAANAQYVMQELSHIFKKETAIKIREVVASSGKLTALIENGAPFNIFLSANMKYPIYLYKHNLTTTKPKVYAKGSLVLWTLKDINLKKKIYTLNNSNITIIAIPNPANAPYGVQAIKAIKSAKLFVKIKSKIVYADSIAQTNQYIYSKSADIGITAKSVVMSPKMRGDGHYIDINTKLYNSIKQGVVVLKYANRSNEKETMQFYHFLFTKKAKNIFKQFGYILPK